MTARDPFCNGELKIENEGIVQGMIIKIAPQARTFIFHFPSSVLNYCIWI